MGTHDRLLRSSVVAQPHAAVARIPDQQAFLEAVAAEDALLAPAHEARLEALQHCLGNLTDSARDLLRRCYGGKTIKEVAHQLGRTPDSVYKAVATIRSCLSRCIAGVLGQEQSP